MSQRKVAIGSPGLHLGSVNGFSKRTQFYNDCRSFCLDVMLRGKTMSTAYPMAFKCSWNDSRTKGHNWVQSTSTVGALLKRQQNSHHMREGHHYYHNVHTYTSHNTASNTEANGQTSIDRLPLWEGEEKCRKDEQEGEDALMADRLSQAHIRARQNGPKHMPVAFWSQPAFEETGAVLNDMRFQRAWSNNYMLTRKPWSFLLHLQHIGLWRRKPLETEGSQWRRDNTEIVNIGLNLTESAVHSPLILI